MKQFFTILKFELDNYFKSKSYVISTILIAVLAAGIMFVPRVKDAITGDKKDSTVQDSASKEDSSAEADAEHTYGVYDPDGILIIDVDGSVWGSMETGINLVSFDSEDALKKAVEEEEAAADLRFIRCQTTIIMYITRAWIIPMRPSLTAIWGCLSNWITVRSMIWI